jgi:hypothetical protein
VGWLGRLRHKPAQDLRPGAEEPERPREALPPPLERAAPGVAALFAGLSADGSHSVLDLGPAAENHLDLYGRFSRQIRVADLLTDPPRGPDWAAALQALPPHPRKPYDVVLVWDLLDRLWPEARPALIKRLAELTAPCAGLYVIVDVSGAPTTRPLRFTLLDLDRMVQSVVGPPRPAHGPLLPAQLERLLDPFRVERAFTLRGGLREYVARKKDT